MFGKFFSSFSVSFLDDDSTTFLQTQELETTELIPVGHSRNKDIDAKGGGGLFSRNIFTGITMRLILIGFIFREDFSCSFAQETKRNNFFIFFFFKSFAFFAFARNLVCSREQWAEKWRKEQFLSFLRFFSNFRREAEVPRRKEKRKGNGESKVPYDDGSMFLLQWQRKKGQNVRKVGKKGEDKWE